MSNTSSYTFNVIANYLDVKLAPYNAIGDGTVDDTLALQTAFDDGATQGIPVFLPAGSYKTTAALVAIGDNIMIYGAGGNLTKIFPDSDNYDCLTIKAASAGSGINPSGYLRDISIEGTTNWVAGFTAGIKLDAMRQFDVSNVNVSRKPIGIDLVNNCYGSTFKNCRVNLGGLALNLRIGVQSGSDITFYNCWLCGNVGAVQISGGSGGFHFYGGQLTGGTNKSADDDTRGVITLGLDFVNGVTVGSVGNVNFDGIDFEGMRYMHVIRGYAPVQLMISNSSFLSTGLVGNTDKPLSVMNLTNCSQSRVTLLNNTIAGVWKSAKAINTLGQGSIMQINEMGTAVVNGAVTFNAVTMPDTMSFLEQSKNALGTAFFRGSGIAKILLGGMMMRPNANKLEISFDWGVTWSIVTSSP